MNLACFSATAPPLPTHEVEVRVAIAAEGSILRRDEPDRKEYVRLRPAIVSQLAQVQLKVERLQQWIASSRPRPINQRLEATHCREHCVARRLHGNPMYALAPVQRVSVGAPPNGRSEARTRRLGLFDLIRRWRWRWLCRACGAPTQERLVWRLERLGRDVARKEEGPVTVACTTRGPFAWRRHWPEPHRVRPCSYDVGKGCAGPVLVLSDHAHACMFGLEHRREARGAHFIPGPCAPELAVTARCAVLVLNARRLQPT
mmetsp:Transcript_32027/g.83832  ORF Transcript_32027/g.83832 Transcript_32027/m.83832 type:complete len:259 (-) Transcript_32027:473-1249(-)